MIVWTPGCEEPSDFDEDHPPPSFSRRGWPDRILLLVGEALDRDRLSINGGDVPMRALERLAADGQVLSNARAGEAAGRGLWATVVELARILSRAGYETMGVVADPALLPPAAPAIGRQVFDAWRGPPDPERELGAPPPSEVRQRTGARLNRAVAGVLGDRVRDQYFLYVHYSDPADLELRSDLEDAADSARYFDRVVEQVTDHLRLMGQLEHTLVIVAGHPSAADEEARSAPQALVVRPALLPGPAVEVLISDLPDLIRARLARAQPEPAGRAAGGVTPSP